MGEGTLSCPISKGGQGMAGEPLAELPTTRRAVGPTESELWADPAAMQLRMGVECSGSNRQAALTLCNPLLLPAPALLLTPEAEGGSL